MEQTQEKIIENGYRLVSILDELAEEEKKTEEALAGMEGIF